jgi:hypothetical protein
VKYENYFMIVVNPRPFLVDFDEPADTFVPSGQAVAGGLIESPFFDRIGGRGKK